MKIKHIENLQKTLESIGVNFIPERPYVELTNSIFTGSVDFKVFSNQNEIDWFLGSSDGTILMDSINTEFSSSPQSPSGSFIISVYFDTNSETFNYRESSVSTIPVEPTITPIEIKISSLTVPQSGSNNQIVTEPVTDALPINSDNFYNNLSTSDDTLNKALTTIDELNIQDWNTIKSGSYNRISNTEIEILNSNYSDWIGYGLMCNDIITSIITTTNYDGTNTNFICSGSVLPNPINSLKYNTGTKKVIIDSNYQPRSFNTESTNIFRLEENANPIFYKGTNGEIVLVENNCLDVRTNPNTGSYNANIINSGSISTIPINLQTGFTGTTTIQNNTIKPGNEIEVSNDNGTGEFDVYGGNMYITIYQY